jgi:hypothetical protein
VKSHSILHFALTFLFGFAVSAAQAQDTMRDFKNAAGIVIKAKVVTITGDKVVIERTDRKQFTVAISTLSVEDQAYLKTWKPSTPATSSQIPSTAGEAEIIPVPKRLNLSDFYAKCVMVEDFPVVSSGKVPDAALLEARKIILMMVAKQPKMLKTLAKNKVRAAIMASTEVTTDIPEHSDLTPKDYWDKRARGVGATSARPATSGAEENLLKLPGDRYKGENIFLHEFAHTLHLMAINDMDSRFDQKLQKAYKEAMAADLWKGTYAATDHKEYWAEGVQSWFNANLEAIPTNGIHNQINTHDELKAYDLGLYELIAEWLPSPP